MCTPWRGGMRGMLGLALLCCVCQGCHALYPFDVPEPDQPVASDAALDAAPDGAGDGPQLQDAPPREVAPPLDNGTAKEANKPPDAGKPKGALCGGPAECAKGLYCVDGYCCGATCKADCVACNVPGSEGSCAPIPAATLKLCHKTCDGDGVKKVYCDGKGACATGVLSSCPDYLVCDPKTNACPAGCTTHKDCVKSTMAAGASLSTGVCDRTAAHKTGLGVCVDPGKVAEVPTANYLVIANALTAVTDVTKSITHVLLRASTTSTIYQIKVTSGQKVVIVGDGRPTLETMTTTNTAAGLLVYGGTLLVQDVTITHATFATFKGHGAACQSGGTLGIYESTIRDNSGLGVDVGAACNFELRRSLVTHNDGGGLRLKGGGSYNITLVNNVIVENGGTGSTYITAAPGLLLHWGGGGQLPLLYNNVVANNKSGGAQAGIECDVSNLTKNTYYDLHNTIVWNNSPNVVSSGCMYHTSDVQGLSPLTSGNINSPPQFDSSAYDLKSSSPAVDQGGAVPTNVTVIDYSGGKRAQGIKTDMGAHER